MAHGNSLFAFLAGAVAGAAMLFFAQSEKGEKIVEEIKEKGNEACESGRSALLKGLDKVEEALEEARARIGKKEEE